MSDNKKKKLSFADALKGQADKLSKETAEVDVGGQAVTVVRGDMSDEAWAKVKARAVKHVPVEISEDEPPSKLGEEPEAKRITAQSVKSIAKNLDFIADSVITADEKKLLKDTSPEGREGFIRERLKKRGYEINDPPAPPTVKVADKPTQGAPTEWQPMPEPKRVKSPGTQTEDDTYVGEGGSPPGSVRGRVGSFLTKVVPPTAQGTTPADAVTPPVPSLENAAFTPDERARQADLQRAAERQAEMDANVARVNAQGEVNSQNDTNALMATGAPSPFDADPNAGNTRTPLDAVNDIGKFLSPVPPNEQQIAAREDAAEVNAQQPAPPPPLPAGGSGSLEVGGRVVPNSGIPTPKVDPRIAATQREGEIAAEAARLKGEASINSLRSQAVVQREGIAEAERLKLANQERVKAETAEYQRHMDGLRDLQQEVMTLSKESIDPNRFWANKDAGQRASAVIAGALFGFTGQGMQWLQRIDSLVAQDIQAQAADLSRRRGVLSDATGIQNNLVAMAERKGLRGDAAYSAALAAQKESLAQKLELDAMNYAEPTIRLKAQQAAALLRQSSMKNTMDLEQDAKLNAAKIAHEYASADAARAQAFHIRASGSSGGTPAQEMKPRQQERLAELLSSADVLSNMWQDYTRMAGGRGSGAVALLDPAGIATDAGIWNSAKMDEYTQIVGRPLEGGMVREEDTKRYRKSYIPSALDTETRAREKVGTLIDYTVAKYRNELNSQRAAGVTGVDNFPTPEQFEKKLRSSMGAPGYAKPK